MIHLLSFDQGIPLNLGLSPDEAIQAVAKQYATKVRVLQAGTHDLTPYQFNFRRFDYTVEITPEGTGILFLTARYRDVVVQKVTAQGLTRPSGGDKAFRMPQDQGDFVLAGPNARRNLVIWLYLFYR